MRRILLAALLVCLAAAIGVWAWMRFGVLFPLPPTSATVPQGGELERIFGNVPPPRFRVLRYREPLDRPLPDGRKIERFTTVRLVENAGWRSVVQNSVAGSPPRPGDYDVGPVGLFTAASGPAGNQLSVGRSRITAVREVKGSLFPLAPGNRLSFTCDGILEAWFGPIRYRQPTSQEEAFEVTGTTDRWPSVPGPVYVIVHTGSAYLPSLGWTGQVRGELHYAPALGAVVYRRIENHYPDGTPHVSEVTLVEWH